MQHKKQQVKVMQTAQKNQEISIERKWMMNETQEKIKNNYVTLKFKDITLSIYIITQKIRKIKWHF